MAQMLGLVVVSAWSQCCWGADAQGVSKGSGQGSPPLKAEAKGREGASRHKEASGGAFQAEGIAPAKSPQATAGPLGLCGQWKVGFFSLFFFLFSSFFCFLFFFLAVLEFELRALHLLSKYHLSHSTSPFCFSYHTNGILLILV
jgi:hypothetical protein